ncbi:hypothetical protein K0M31_010780 [Melipona bicolor]|uniref:Uncharacterized protein n=1 Tax=Melipona bicolor TaxID=60889 RepID=A0AA40FKV1_9HYME|nr:hypothetical protein K0M31_010780 [Melipona bicolor]
MGEKIFENPEKRQVTALMPGVILIVVAFTPGCVIKVRQKRFFFRGHRGTVDSRRHRDQSGNSSAQQCTTMMPISRRKRIIVYQKRETRRRSLETRVSKTAVSSVGPRLVPVHPLHYYPLGKHPGSIRGHSTHGLNASAARSPLVPPRSMQFTRKRTRMCFMAAMQKRNASRCLTGYSIHNNVAGEFPPAVDAPREI